MSQWLSSQGTERHGRWQVQERHICTDMTVDSGIIGVFCTLLTLHTANFSPSSKLGHGLELGASEAFLDLSILTWRKFKVVMKEISPVFESPAEF